MDVYQLMPNSETVRVLSTLAKLALANFKLQRWKQSSVISRLFANIPEAGTLNWARAFTQIIGLQN